MFYAIFWQIKIISPQRKREVVLSIIHIIVVLINTNLGLSHGLLAAPFQALNIHRSHRMSQLLCDDGSQLI